MVRLELGKRDFVWIGLIVILTCVGFGYAYNSGVSPSVMGHSSGEVEIEAGDLMGNCRHSWGASTQIGVALEPAFYDSTPTGSVDGVITRIGCQCRPGWQLVWTGVCAHGSCLDVNEIYFYACIKI